MCGGTSKSHAYSPTLGSCGGPYCHQVACSHALKHVDSNWKRPLYCQVQRQRLSKPLCTAASLRVCGNLLFCLDHGSWQLTLSCGWLSGDVSPLHCQHEGLGSLVPLHFCAFRTFLTFLGFMWIHAQQWVPFISGMEVTAPPTTTK